MRRVLVALALAAGILVLHQAFVAARLPDGGPQRACVKCGMRSCYGTENGADSCFFVPDYDRCTAEQRCYKCEEWGACMTIRRPRAVLQ